MQSPYEGKRNGEIDMFQEMQVGVGGGGKSVAVIDTTLPSNRYFNCGFEPKKIMISMFFSSGGQNGQIVFCYDADVSKAQCKREYYLGTSYISDVAIGDVSGTMSIEYVDTNGFKLSSACSTNNANRIIYVASE